MRIYLSLVLLCGAAAVAEIQPEPQGIIQSLPEKYPSNWVILQDAAFFHMLDGKFVVVDASADDPTEQFKGMFNGSFIANFTQAETRPEMYVAETFYSRGTRGTRTDVLTIYDKATLAPVDEVVLPAKRISGMPTDYYLRLVDDEKVALLYNFTPATSVSVIDLENREFLNEVPIPGCALIYPMAGRAFSSLCTNGTMLTVQLDENGAQASAERSDVFFDAEADPLTEKAALIDGVAYFPSFLGMVHPVDLSGSRPSFGEPFSLVDGVEGGWRPGGINLAGGDAAGNMYVLMHPEGYNGSHKDPGTEVWVVDPTEGTVQRRIELTLPAITMGITQGDDPLLLTTNVNLQVDVYDAATGEYQRTLSDLAYETVFMLHGAR